MKYLKGTYVSVMLSIILSTYILSACSKYSVSNKIEQAEKLMWDAPDSSLHILESISNHGNMINEENAIYILLLTLAQYRCDVPITSDSSSVNYAVEYGIAGNDENRKGTSLYIKGCMLNEKYGDISKSLKTYKEAESFIPNMKRTPFVGRIYSSIAYINLTYRNYETAKEYYKKALKENTALKDTTSQVSDLLNLMACYCILHKADSTDLCIRHLTGMVQFINDPLLKAKVYNNIANRYIFEGEYFKAEKYLLYAMKSSPTHPLDGTLLGLAKFYLKIGKKEKSDSTFTSLLSSHNKLTQANAYLGLLNNFLMAYPNEKANLEHYTAISDSFYSEKNAIELETIQKKYDSELLAHANNNLRSQKVMILLITGICLLFLSSLLWKKWKQIRTLQKRIEELEKKKNALINESKNVSLSNDMYYVSQIKELEYQISNLKNEKRRLKYSINNIHRAQNNDVKEDYARLFSTYLSITKDGIYNSKTDREILGIWLNYTNHDFAKKLIDTYPNLSGRNLDVCYLSALNLNISEIAALLEVNERTVEKYMSNICKEINYKNGGKNVFECFINSLK